MDPVHITAYIALFGLAGFAFLFVNLLVGKFLRPHDPHAEKQEIYECGEPAIGTSFVQFDLRFYVVALLFLIFDVEVAFFFPWAAVFGKANHLRDEQLYASPDAAQAVAGLYHELGVPPERIPGVELKAEIQQTAQQLAWFSFFDILVFFGVLLVGFAYVWMRGDIDWVRAMTQRAAARGSRGPPPSTPAERQPALV
jgi:NADH-quinone oxidoreductase subunit A